jgi:hypothetical protein
MLTGHKRTITLAIGLIAFMAFVAVEEGSGQILAIGGHASMNQDISDETTWGWGARGQIGLPLTSLAIQGTLDFFSPDCDSQDCELQEVSVNLLWTLPIPWLAKPYLGAGVAVQNSEGDWDLGDQSDYGVNALAGIILQGPTFPRFQPFGEVKFQSMEDFDSQTVFTFGILLALF